MLFDDNGCILLIYLSNISNLFIYLFIIIHVYLNIYQNLPSFSIKRKLVFWDNKLI